MPVDTDSKQKKFNLAMALKMAGGDNEWANNYAAEFLDNLSGGAVDTLFKLYKYGRQDDGDLPAKSGYAELVQLGLAITYYDTEENTKPNRLTDLGYRAGELLAIKISSIQRESLESLKVLMSEEPVDNTDKRIAFNTLIANLLPTYQGDLDLDEDTDKLALIDNILLRSDIEEDDVPLGTNNIPLALTMESIAGFSSEVVSLREMAKTVMLGSPLERGTWLAGVIEQRLQPLGMTLGPSKGNWSYQQMTVALEALQARSESLVDTGLSAIDQIQVATMVMVTDKRISLESMWLQSLPETVQLPPLDKLDVFIEQLKDAANEVESRTNSTKTPVLTFCKKLREAYEKGITLDDYTNNIPDANDRPYITVSPFPEVESVKFLPVTGLQYGDKFNEIGMLLERLNRQQADLRLLSEMNTPILNVLLLEGGLSDEAVESLTNLRDLLVANASLCDRIAETADQVLSVFSAVFVKQ